MLKPYFIYSFKFVLLLFTFAFSMYGTFYSYVEFGLGNIHYFTNQSNLIVFLATFLMMFGWDKSVWFKKIALIALLDIILTGLVYNILLKDLVVDFTETQLFIMLVTHTIVPLLYTVLYLVFVLDKPSYKDLYILMIHPGLYFISAQVIGLFTHYYPYPFLNPNQGILMLLVLNLGILLPLLVLGGYGLIALKRYLNDALQLKA